MRFGVLGTGTVGQTLAGKLVDLGDEVRMGSRQAGNENARSWVESAGERASEGDFADAAAFGEVVINATAGTASLAALEAAGADNLAGKVLLDVANPLDFSGGFPPTLSICNDDSLGESVQRAFPDARVVKALNTVGAEVMIDPVPDTTIFVAGDDADAKQEVRGLLSRFGWAEDAVYDLGDIAGARAMEMYLPLWLRLLTTSGSRRVTVKAVVSG